MALVKQKNDSEENLEDMEDAFLADQCWEKVLAGEPVFTHEEILARYGLE